MTTVSVVATVEASTGPTDPPRIRLDVTDTGSPTIFATTVTRLNPDGRTVPVRTVDGEPLALSTSGSNRIGLVYDYEAPFGESVTYSTLESPGLSSATVVLPSSEPWLIHPGLPELSRPIELRAGSLAEESYPLSRGVFQPMGRETPVIVTDGSRRSMQSQIVVWAETAGEIADIRNLVRDGTVLLLNIPPDLGLAVDTAYVSIGDIVIGRASDIGSDAYRNITMPFIVTARPAGGTQAERTLIDLVEYGSLAGIAAAYATLFDVAVGP